MNACHSRAAGPEGAEMWSGTAAGRGASALFRKLAAWIRREIAIRVAVARLESLPDELLTDVGIRRVDIDRAVRNARIRDPFRSA